MLPYEMDHECDPEKVLGRPRGSVDCDSDDDDD